MQILNFKKAPGTTLKKRLILPVMGTLAVAGLISFNGCQKTDLMQTATETGIEPDLERLMNSNFTTVNLVSDAAEYAPMFIDDHLVNAWGLAFNDEGEAWVASADEGVTTVYDADGVTLLSPVGIPFMGDPTGGEPTGTIYNTTSGFIIPTGEPAEFIYSTENGTIVAVNATTGYTMADRSAAGAIYKGLAWARAGASNYLYATDFHNARVDVFNSEFVYQEGFSFMDPDMPAGYAPFNIHLINDQLFVTYAKQLAPENADDEAGEGHGYVDVYSTGGVFQYRFASNGSLNSPWGIEQTIGAQGAILIGNFGSGMISVYDSEGNFKSYLKSDGSPIMIEGLWSIVFPRKNLTEDIHNRLYFTAGPDDESHGVFGYLNPVE